MKFSSPIECVVVMSACVMASFNSAAADRLSCPATREVAAQVEMTDPSVEKPVVLAEKISLPLVSMLISVQHKGIESPQVQIPRDWKLPRGVFKEWNYEGSPPEVTHMLCDYGQDGVFSILLVSHVPFDRCRVVQVKGKPVNGRRPVDMVEAYCERLEPRAGEPRIGQKSP